MTDVLEQWNRLTPEEALAIILPCNGAPLWAEVLVQGRPFASEQLLLLASDEVWAALPREQWQQAFDSHPRLGEGHAPAATAQSLTWSAGEQSGLSQTSSDLADLTAANREYERRFGRIFLLCASGKSTAEVLGALRHRLDNDPETEWHIAAEEQRRITQLRLRRWLGLPSPRCEAV